jgi:hypothetical protein
MMRIIYATGRPRSFEFGTANEHGQLPSGAIVLAVAEGSSLSEHLDEDIFARMTDEEYYELQELIHHTGQFQHTLH